VKKRFRWDAWNIEHIAKHRVSQSEAEYVVRNALPPYPRAAGGEKEVVRGQTADGRYVQVVYIFDSDEDFDYENASFEDMLSLAADDDPPIYVIHARELSTSEKHRYRRIR
jgi:hypothetical protein